jgi:hypothetical protein
MQGKSKVGMPFDVARHSEHYVGDRHLYIVNGRVLRPGPNKPLFHHNPVRLRALIIICLRALHAATFFLSQGRIGWH